MGSFFSCRFPGTNLFPTSDLTDELAETGGMLLTFLWSPYLAMAVLTMLFEARRRRGRRRCIVTFQGWYRATAAVGSARIPTGFPSAARCLTLVAADAVRGALRTDLPRVRRRVSEMEDRHVWAPETEISLLSRSVPGIVILTNAV